MLESAEVPVAPPLFGDWSVRSGYELGRLLAQDREVTAIFAANDEMALGVMRAMSEAGREVPRDVSIIGFDDVPFARYLTPPLTTVRQDFEGLGQRSVHLLMDAIAASTARACRSDHNGTGRARQYRPGSHPRLTDVRSASGSPAKLQASTR